MRNLSRLSKPMTIKLFLLFQKTIYKSSLRFISDFFNVDKNYTVFQNTQEKILFYEYRDLFIDMDVGNNRSELAMANRHQERWNFIRWKTVVHGLRFDERCFRTSENLPFAVLIGWPERATPARRLV